RVDGYGDWHAVQSVLTAARAVEMPCALSAPMLLAGFALDDLLAAVIAVRADVMAAMGFAADRLDRERGARKRGVGAVHAALGRGFLVLLDSHLLLLM